MTEPGDIIHLYRPNVSTQIAKVCGIVREEAIRLYCFQAGQTWSLQVRGPIRLQNGTEGKDFIVATAHLTADDLRALREAIDLHLKEL